MLRLFFLSIISALIFSSAFAEENPVVRQNDIPKLVRQYLMDNPEVIIEAVQQAQEKAQEEEKKAAAEAVGKAKGRIFGNKDAPSLGKADAKVTVAQFYDYNCSACKFMYQGVKKLVDEGLPEDVRIIFMEFPIFGEQSETLARYALAVNRLHKDKFFAFHGGMMGFKGHPTDQQIAELITSLGMKMEDVKKEADSNKVRAIVGANKQLGQELRIGGTPFVIVNDSVTPHAMDYAALMAAITEARK